MQLYNTNTVQYYKGVTQTSDLLLARENRRVLDTALMDLEP